MLANKFFNFSPVDSTPVFSWLAPSAITNGAQNTVSAKALREERAKLTSEIKRLADLANDKEHAWSNEDEQRWVAVNTDYNSLTAKIEEAEGEERTIAKRAEMLDRARQIEAEQRAVQPGLPHATLSRQTEDIPAVTEEHRALALQAWCRSQWGMDIEDRHAEAVKLTGYNVRGNELFIPLAQPQIMQGRHLRSLAMRAHSVASDSAGGYTVPEGFMANLEAALLQYGGILNVADIMRTADGRPLPWPTTNDTSNKGELIGENTAVGEQDVLFGSVTFNARKVSSKLILVSHELLRDSAFNLASTIGSIAGERIGRKWNELYTTGTGAGIQPQGIVTGATSGKTANSATAITIDEIYDLIHSVDPAYRVGASFMMHDNVALAIRKLKDGNGQYLWQSDVRLGMPDRLAQYTVQINQDMASSVSSGAKTILFGAMSKYKVREVAGVRLRRLDERYAENDQVGFIAFMEGDGALLDAGTNPVKYLVQAQP